MAVRTRICFFNELDTFALAHNLDSQSILDGVTSDPRIGSHYCNPSFGYGGYCLPKDTKQLESHFGDLPQEIFSSVIKSNISRIKYIASYIASLDKKVIGVYLLAMKKTLIISKIPRSLVCCKLSRSSIKILPSSFMNP